MTTQQPDFLIRHDGGSVVGFEPISQAARHHAMVFCEQEPCNWFGRAFWVNTGAAGYTMLALQDQGFTIGSMGI